MSTSSRENFIWGFIGANVAVFFAWSTAKNNPVRHGSGRRTRIVTLSELHPSNVESLITMETMRDNFTLSPRNITQGRWWTLLTSAISHQDPVHLFLNMVTFKTLSIYAFRAGVSVRSLTTLALFTTVASSASYLWDVLTRTGPKDPNVGAHGASGMVSGMGIAVALMRPYWRVRYMFMPISLSLWSVTAGVMVWDLWSLVRERSRRRNVGRMRIGYACHLGGAVAGAAYYFLKLRHLKPRYWYGGKF